MQTGWALWVSDYFKSHVFASYAVSVLIGALITYPWSRFIHARIRKIYPPDKQEPVLYLGRVWWMPVIVGMFERAIIQTLTIWIPSSLGGFLAGWMVLKAAGGWGMISKGTDAGRAYFFAGVLGTTLSILFALVIGLLSAPYWPHGSVR